MAKRTLGIIVRLLLVITALCWGVGQASAQKKAQPKTKITDAAGRTHVRPTPRISDAQRKAAAQHRKAVRAKSAYMVNTSGVKK